MPVIESISRLRLLPVISLSGVEKAEPLATALIDGGLPVAEITLRTDSALAGISKLADKQDFLVGAGTVHSAEQARQAADAGARFIVTPGINPKTVTYCLDKGIPVYPGISSPTDLETAMELGLSVVKFFPAELNGGVKMLKALQGPYEQMKFVPTGGINLSNLQSYLELESVVACGGSWMVKKDLIREDRFDEIRQLTSQAVEITSNIESQENGMQS